MGKLHELEGLQLECTEFCARVETQLAFEILTQF